MAELQNMIEVGATLPTLDVNFDALKAHLETELERYDVVLTADNVREGKALATELNKTAGVIDERRKQEVAKVSEPIKLFDGQMRELVSLCKDGRQRLLDQIKTFEDETRAEVYRLLFALRAKLWKQSAVDQAFANAEFDDLVIVSSLTGGGSLTKKAADVLTERVNADKQAQDRRERRLLELENASYKAGLQTPLEYRHVAGIVDNPDDDAYQQALTAMLDDEIERQRQVEQRAAEKAQREERERQEAQRRAEAAERERQQRQAERDRQEAERQRQPDPTQPASTEPDQHSDAPEPEPGKQQWKVIATFYPSVSSSVTARALEAELRRVMEKAGIKTLANVWLEPVRSAEHEEFLKEMDEA